MNVVEFKAPPAKDVIAPLERLLQLAKDGKLTGFVGVVMVNNEYETHSSESIAETLAVASFLQHWAAKRYFG